MTMVGADVAELRHVGSALDRCSQRLVAIRGALTRGLSSSPWRGGDAQRFRQRWNAQLAPRLTVTADTLAAAARTLAAEADEQERASESGGSRLGGSAGSAGGRSGDASPRPLNSQTKTRSCSFPKPGTRAPSQQPDLKGAGPRRGAVFRKRHHRDWESDATTAVTWTTCHATYGRLRQYC